MITLFNYWHYLVLSVLLLIFIGFAVLVVKQEDSKQKYQIVLLFFVLYIIIAGIGMVVVDKYTKTAKLYRLENKRNLSTEKIMYSGVVRNEGDYEIGEVVLEIKLVNGGSDTGSVKSGMFFKPSGFTGLFSSGVKPQQITEEFVVAKNLKPKQSQDFIVYLDYPPYFRSVSHFSKLYVH
ncbi:MAG: hypothetical protein A3E21_05620 [Sulfurimonas sp. RIFCSPHIGHO2_12_FULL_36_9]|jgi:cytochrome c biogenesis factor|uniref:DUF2393 family protein n=1 Tax=Sulfurimonas sp. RIFCSPLOWO2_12_36_12 TaxID=1802253 RepID=UPI0008BBAD29|nr:DUF2393 family protein [Sulfurimonas sp. RIFCSPLOWO2_12_36_12]OHD96919.1 MAG: hypothetical protein A3J26_08265 [Sulfurimonas sp. RIFCSPLOWO2_02_FULL_36_28]OHD99181.1 MAG: hypothetical protein A3E21_05620 [Sulfurimonas sp. RIFCSPHIGHO2_12_FULL_36_9]OHE02155.1 MAG: hypothetical protein A2W82_01800 [Sulfurimonas sp. RIFCSPLOWO2_12_36_12]OHE08620.1 MAG: hypothetical protein A3K14_07420 [Sulfurimonas sp. RIFCSPLOWO2_12_FULL_36_74]